MRSPLNAAALAACVAMIAGGCGMQKPWGPQKPWGRCAHVGGLVGAALGGTAAGVYRYNSDDDKPSDKTMIGVTGAGAAGGAVLGALLGHLICDREAPPPPVEPAPPPPPPAGTEIIELRGTHFAFDSAELTAEGEAILERAVTVMSDHPSIMVSIEGHTCAIGSEAYNMGLGQRRADSVEGYLVSRGITADRLSTISYGEGSPAASNDTEEGREQNRRVELIVR